MLFGYCVTLDRSNLICISEQHNWYTSLQLVVFAYLHNPVSSVLLDHWVCRIDQQTIKSTFFTVIGDFLVGHIHFLLRATQRGSALLNRKKWLIHQQTTKSTTIITMVSLGHIHLLTQAIKCRLDLLDNMTGKIYQQTTKSMPVIIIGDSLVIFTFLHDQSGVDLLCLTARSVEYISRRQCRWLSQVLVIS